MPKTTLTIADVTDISYARHILQHHRPVQKGLRRACTECGDTWGVHGCADHLWAVDYLSQFSLILVPDRPERPRHRHRPEYVAKLVAATARISRRLGYRQRSDRPLGYQPPGYQRSVRTAAT